MTAWSIRLRTAHQKFDPANLPQKTPPATPALPSTVAREQKKAQCGQQTPAPTSG